MMIVGRGGILCIEAKRGGRPGELTKRFFYGWSCRTTEVVGGNTGGFHHRNSIYV